MEVAPLAAYEQLHVAAAPASVVASIRRLLEEQGVIVYAVVDHGRDMAAAGADGHVAWTIIFGNPAAGARVLDADPLAAVDIPLRLAVIADDRGASIVLRDVATLLRPELATIAQSLTGVLRTLASAAAVAAERDAIDNP